MHKFNDIVPYVRQTYIVLLNNILSQACCVSVGFGSRNIDLIPIIEDKIKVEMTYSIIKDPLNDLDLAFTAKLFDSYSENF